MSRYMVSKEQTICWETYVEAENNLDAMNKAEEIFTGDKAWKYEDSYDPEWNVRKVFE